MARPSVSARVKVGTKVLIHNRNGKHTATDFIAEIKKHAYRTRDHNLHLWSWEVQFKNGVLLFHPRDRGYT